MRCSMYSHFLTKLSNQRMKVDGLVILQDPVYVYPFEALEGFTMALMMTSAVTYVARISTQAGFMLETNIMLRARLPNGYLLI